MSTRAIYTFKDEDATIHVYKHFDGYPEGAAGSIGAALDYAWPLPRFEADEFAAAFACAAKLGRGRAAMIANGLSPDYQGGDVRLIAREEPWDFAADAAFWYIVTADNGALNVEAYSVRWEHGHGPNTESLIYNGPLGGLAAAQAA